MELRQVPRTDVPDGKIRPIAFLMVTMPPDHNSQIPQLAPEFCKIHVITLAQGGEAFIHGIQQSPHRLVLCLHRVNDHQFIRFAGSFPHQRPDVPVLGFVVSGQLGREELPAPHKARRILARVFAECVHSHLDAAKLSFERTVHQRVHSEIDWLVRHGQLPIRDRRVVPLRRADIDLPRSTDLRFGIHDHLTPLGNPPW